MPVKNAAPWLRDCLYSIQNQTFTHWQLIAVDDFSTDDSWKKLKEFSQQDNRITVLKNNAPGITYALQLAFEKSDGEYITRMDADDVMPPEKLERLLAVAQNNPNCIATGLVKYFGDKPISIGYQEYEAWLNKRVTNADHKKHLFRECVVASPNWLTHRKNIEAIAPFAEHTYPEDYDLVFRWMEKELEITGVKQVTHLWREHTKRTSRTSEHYNQQHFFNLKLAWFLKLEYDKRRPLVIFGENVKTEICKTFFNKHKIGFMQLDRVNYQKLAGIIQPLLLCTVYDSPKTRNSFEEYFSQNTLVIGKDWWYL